MTNLRAPPSRASSTFCLSSWRLPTISCPSTPTTTTPRLSFCRLKLMSAPPQSAASLLALSRGVGLQYGHRRRVHNIVGGGAARQVGDRSRQALQDGADRLPAVQTLHQFVRDVAAVKIGEHEHVGAARHRRAGGLTTGDVGHERGVALELAVEREIGGGRRAARISSARRSRSTRGPAALPLVL